MPTLSQARVTWHRSLRVRLALVLSMVTAVLVAVVGFAMMSFLLRAMESQFQLRLQERIDTLAVQFSDPSAGLGAPPDPQVGAGLAATLERDGTVLNASKDLPLTIGEPFPYPTSGPVTIAGSPFRGMSQELSGFSEGKTLWVALPSGPLVDARRSAGTALLFALLLTPLLTFALAYLLGQRMLQHLGKAAALADGIHPAAEGGMTELPLPPHRDEVHRLISAINRLLVRVDAQQAREKALLGQIVHELGAPLTVLKATLDRAGARTGDPEIQKAALVADELTFTTQDLMQLARGELEFKLAWHLIAAESLRERLERLVPGTQYAGDWSGQILCDPDRLTQALRNLLANARRAAGVGGTVTLGLAQVGDRLAFTVRDSGAGLPAGLGERIFDPFVSGSGSSGLGLSVSRQIAEQHGGTLTGRNSESGGAEFVLQIPDALLTEDDEDDVGGGSNMGGDTDNDANASDSGEQRAEAALI